MSNEVNTIKVWITKYALTKGIEEKDAEICLNPNGDMIKIIGNWYGEYYHKDEWHRTKESAIKKAEEMRQSKLKSLNKQIDKINKLKFD